MRINKKITAIIITALVFSVIFYAFASDGTFAVSLDYLLDVFKPEILSETSFKVVSVPEGERFYGSAGCEFILRGGSGTIRGSELGGLNDATSGDDLFGGIAVPPNHLLIVPRDDGRGFVADSDTIIMVKGKYYIGK